MKRLISTLLLGLAALPVLAQVPDATIRKAFEEKLKTKIAKISKTPMPGIYEVIADGQILYADEKAGYFIHGDMRELRTLRNLTAEKKFSMLPLELAVKTVRGSGKNVVVTFEDPNCGYCKKLAKDLVKVKDTTVYTFVYSVLGEDSVAKSKAILCATDRSKAWNEWMQNNVSPPAPAASCDVSSIMNRTAELGQQLGIRGTPFLMFANGQQAPGYIPADEIAKRLAGDVGS